MDAMTVIRDNERVIELREYSAMFATMVAVWRYWSLRQKFVFCKSLRESGWSARDTTMIIQDVGDAVRMMGVKR